MPTVRRYGDLSQTARPIPGARRTLAATPESEGAGLEQAKADTHREWAKLGGQAARLGADAYIQIQRQAEEDAFQTARLSWNNKAAAYRTNALYGERGLYKRTGQEAMSGPEEIAQGFDTQTEEWGKGLTKRQRMAFDADMSQLRGSMDLESRHYVNEQAQAMQASEAQAYMKNQIGIAISSVAVSNDMGTIVKNAQGGIANSRKALQDNAKALKILGPEQMKAADAAMVNDVHAGFIADMVNRKKTAQARAYFSMFGTEMNQKAQQEVRTLLETADVQDQAVAQADAIIAQYPTRSEQMTEAKKIEDKEVRKEVEHRLDQNYTRVKLDKADREDDYAARATDILEANNGDLQKIPATIWKELDPTTRDQMRVRAENIAKKKPVEGGGKVYYDLMIRARDEPEKFMDRAQTNLNHYRAQLTEGEAHQLIGMQASSPEGRKALEIYKWSSSMADNTLRLHGLDPNTRVPAAIQANAQFQYQLDQFIAKETRDGIPPPAEVVQAEADRILEMRIATPGGWFSGPGSKRAVETTIEDIPEARREAARVYLREHGLASDDAAVVNRVIQKDFEDAQATAASQIPLDVPPPPYGPFDNPPTTPSRRAVVSGRPSGGPGATPPPASALPPRPRTPAERSRRRGSGGRD